MVWHGILVRHGTAWYGILALARHIPHPTSHPPTHPTAFTTPHSTHIYLAHHTASATALNSSSLHPCIFPPYSLLSVCLFISDLLVFAAGVGRVVELKSQLVAYPRTYACVVDTYRGAGWDEWNKWMNEINIYIYIYVCVCVCMCVCVYAYVQSRTELRTRRDWVYPREGCYACCMDECLLLPGCMAQGSVWLIKICMN